MSTELVERLRAHVAELEEKLERESGDLRYAKIALDRETARALKFGKRIDVLTAKVALLTHLVQTLIDNDPDEPIADSGETVLDLWRYDARRALSEPDKEGML